VLPSQSDRIVALSEKMMTRAKHALSAVEGTQRTLRECEAGKTRNPKFETNPNDQKAQSSKQALRTSIFGFRLPFVSDFELRISDFS
jgi:hypothetical protein